VCVCVYVCVRVWLKSPEKLRWQFIKDACGEGRMSFIQAPQEQSV